MGCAVRVCILRGHEVSVLEAVSVVKLLEQHWQVAQLSVGVQQPVCFYSHEMDKIIAVF